jgi:hypothetical protein
MSRRKGTLRQIPEHLEWETRDGQKWAEEFLKLRTNDQETLALWFTVALAIGRGAGILQGLARWRNRGLEQTREPPYKCPFCGASHSGYETGSKRFLYVCRSYWTPAEGAVNRCRAEKETK